jgi:hypothetical protein
MVLVQIRRKPQLTPVVKVAVHNRLSVSSLPRPTRSSVSLIRVEHTGSVELGELGCVRVVEAG